MNLDPAAVDAAAKQVYETDPEGMNALGFGEAWEMMDSDGAAAVPYYRGIVTTAITAYQRHQAAAVREAWKEVGEAVRHMILAETGAETSEAIIRLDAAEAALLALVGAQEDAE